jgi:hypothetical protein
MEEFCYNIADHRIRFTGIDQCNIQLILYDAVNRKKVSIR